MGTTWHGAGTLRSSGHCLPNVRTWYRLVVAVSPQTYSPGVGMQPARGMKSPHCERSSRSVRTVVCHGRALMPFLSVGERRGGGGRALATKGA